MPKYLKMVLFLCIVFTCGFQLTPCGLYAQDKIIAIVNDEVITQKDLDNFASFTRMELETKYHGKQLEEKIASMKHDLINRLIEDRLILQEAKRTLEEAKKDKNLYFLSRLEIDPGRVKSRINEIKKGYFSDIEFQEALAQQGMNQADLEEKLRDQMLTYGIIDLKVKDAISVSPLEVTDYFQQNSVKFKLSEQREFVSLAIEDRKMADEIYAKAKKGESLENIALAYALKLERITALKGEHLRPEIESIIFSLYSQGIAQPTKIENSYYIFRLDKIIPPRQQALSDAQDSIHAFLVSQKMEKALTSWLDEIKKKSYIQICH